VTLRPGQKPGRFFFDDYVAPSFSGNGRTFLGEKRRMILIQHRLS